ncbi:MAG: hypothetical protein DRP15_00015 [Candidatus Aenigmatarchaeota archaeon]|nr:MAG: hypothetical protein DRP15_00015 [Candidatus Aenigmarchaeota archaeon]
MLKGLKKKLKIREKIKEKLRPKEYIVATESPEAWREAVSKGVSRELARLEGEVERLRRENENLRKQLRAKLKVEEKALIEEAHKLEEKLKKKIKQKSIRIEFNFPRPVIITSIIGHEPFRGTDGEYYRFWRGIELTYTNEGTYFSLLLSKKPKDKKLGKLGFIPFENFLSLFENPYALVNDLKLGIVKIMLTPDGKLIPQTLPCYSIKNEEKEVEVDDPPEEKEEKKEESKPSGRKTKKKAKSKKEEKKESEDKSSEVIEKTIARVKELDTREFIRTRDPETIGTVLAAWDYAQHLISERFKAAKIEKQALLDKLDAELALEIYKEHVDRLGSFLKAALDKLDVMSDRLAETKMLETDARVKAAISEGVTMSQWEAIRRLYERIERLGLSPEERVRRNVERDINFAISRVMETLGIAKGLAQEVRKGGEEKKKG